MYFHLKKLEGNFTNLDFLSCCFREITKLTAVYNESKFQLSGRGNKLKSLYGNKSSKSFTF